MNNEITHTLQLHPEIKQLMDDCEKLTSYIALLVSELAAVKRNTIPNLEARYMATVGAIKYEILKADVRIRYLTRKIEMIQAALNAQKPVDIASIEILLHIELKDWNDQIDAMARNVRRAKTWEGLKWMTPEQTYEMKRLYRELVKRLHPDLHGEMTDEEKSWWEQTQEAYADGDVKMLQALHAVVMMRKPSDKSENTNDNPLDLWKAKRDRFEKMAQDVSAKIAKLKGEFPLSIREQIESPEWIETETGELSRQLEIISAKIQFMEGMLTQMVIGN